MESAIALNVLVDNIVEMNEHFGNVAAGDGAAPLLVLVGTILVIFSVAVFGGLTLGAVGSLFTSN
ncbi:hypothetical protein [Natrarchaeobaculum aegyptiacum]|uniref:Uncharacterized protein n=1 Tax=Natrarchaeobaculum aegyptiacum TaxID=745377 RepID=A0A2Z2HU89_9EURY|nr:hypothetical protein [Natrarchaeobaculum aegyptiacum]ARS89057.1 hypothetical protein B1756_04325 [Natrarchaeobaculum aegyptiacum]